ncbi:MAG: FHA domain-containing protein [Pseudomonadota bacterium]
MSESEHITDRRSFIIGREGHIYINDIAVSKQHAEIKLVDGRVHIRDLNSTNGTYLLKDKKLVHLKAEYVHLDQPIVLGSKMYTARKLLKVANNFAVS